MTATPETNYRVMPDGSVQTKPAVAFFIQAEAPTSGIDRWTGAKLPTPSVPTAELEPTGYEVVPVRSIDPTDAWGIAGSSGPTAPPTSYRTGQPVSVREAAFSQTLKAEDLIELATDPILGGIAVDLIGRMNAESLQREIDLANQRTAATDIEYIETQAKINAMLDASLALSGAATHGTSPREIDLTGRAMAEDAEIALSVELDLLAEEGADPWSAASLGLRTIIDMPFN